MADNTQEIEFNGINNVSRVVDSIIGDIQLLGKTTKDLTAKYAAVARTGEVLGRKLKYIGYTAAAAASSIFWLSYRTSNAAEDMLNLSEKTGVSVEALQQLGYVADQANVGAETLAQGFKFLNRSIAEGLTDSSSTAAQAFAGLGINLLDASGKAKDTEAVFYEVSDAFSNAADGSIKVNTAMKLLGRGGSELIPVLNRGGDALKKQGLEFAKYGNQIDQGAAEAISGFNQEVGKAMVAIKGLGSMIAQAFIPYLQPLVTMFTTWYATNKELIKLKITEWVGNAVTAFKNFIPTLQKGWNEFNKLIDEIGGWKGVMTLIAGFLAADWLVALTNFTYAVGALGLAFATTPIGAFLLLMTGLYFAVKKLDEAFPELGKTVVGTLDEMINKFKELFGMGDDKVTTPQMYVTRQDASGKVVSRGVGDASKDPLDILKDNPVAAGTLGSDDPGMFSSMYEKLRGGAETKPLDVSIKLDTENKISYASIDSPNNAVLNLDTGQVVTT